MEVKAGFKQTEVGVIPEDWISTTVGELVKNGILEQPLDGNHGNIHPKSSDFVNFGIPFVMANNVQGGHVDLNNCAFIRKEQADTLQKGFSKQGDVLLTHKATIGNTAVVGEIPFEYIMLTPQVTYYRVADSSRLLNLYLRQFFDSFAFQSKLQSLSGGGTRAYIGITAQRSLPVALPQSKAEQEAIAEALSNADALIESLEQLIAKKRQIKQGAMQELLTGKRRLPGFEVNTGCKKTEVGGIPEDWRIHSLDSIYEISAGGDLDKANYSATEHQNYPFPIYSNAHTNKGLYGYSRYYLYEAGKITVTARGEIGHAEYRNTRFCAIGRLLVLDPKQRHDPRFVSDFINNVVVFALESTGVPQLTAPQISKYKIALPPTETEQEAIATVLSDMDADITALEAKLAKTRQLKQGMMQELLTGRIRLV